MSTSRQSSIPTLYIENDAVMLPENKLYTNRFEIKSESSGRIYVVAQNKDTKGWSCSCPGWIRHRKCKHLESMGLPAFLQPYEVKIV